MSVMDDASPPTPDRQAYTRVPEIAGSFENQILYAMCRDYPAHDNPYVTAGKITVIGRIYAAAPERGAGSGRETSPHAHAIGNRLSKSSLDKCLRAITFAERFSDLNRVQVVQAHRLLVDEVLLATRAWSTSFDDGDRSPRNQASFSSEYLHFHRPNAFPIMDKYARAGLHCAGLKGPFDNYERFCAGFAEHVEDQEPGWTPRKIDTRLVIRGRAHHDRNESHCSVCGIKFIRRSRKPKLVK